MIRIVDDHDIADAGALIADAGYALIPVRHCPVCGEARPGGHPHDLPPAPPIHPTTSLEARLTAQGVAAVLEAITPGGETP